MMLCKICVAEKGVTIRDAFKSEDELFDHLESYHHMPVIREGETEAQSISRFLKSNPQAVKCANCIESGAAWAK